MRNLCNCGHGRVSALPRRPLIDRSALSLGSGSRAGRLRGGSSLHLGGQACRPGSGRHPAADRAGSHQDCRSPEPPPRPRPVRSPQRCRSRADRSALAGTGHVSPGCSTRLSRTGPPRSRTCIQASDLARSTSRDSSGPAPELVPATLAADGPARAAAAALGGTEGNTAPDPAEASCGGDVPSAAGGEGCEAGKARRQRVTVRGSRAEASGWPAPPAAPTAPALRARPRAAACPPRRAGTSRHTRPLPARARLARRPQPERPVSEPGQGS